MTIGKYFTHAEIACKHCGKAKVMDSFATKLVELREAWGRPMIITSCCRCFEHNKNIGGAAKSFHVFDSPKTTGINATCAADISVKNMDGKTRWAFVNLAFKHGWSVGVHKSFIHIDRRSDYPETGWESPVLFAY